MIDKHLYQDPRESYLGSRIEASEYLEISFLSGGMKRSPDLPEMPWW